MLMRLKYFHLKTQRENIMRLKRIVFAFSALILGTAGTCHAAYDLVEWIQANSLGNAWINSGATPESEEVVYEVEWVETSQESLTALFGATAWSGSTALYGTVGYHSSAGKIAFWTGRSNSL